MLSYKDRQDADKKIKYGRMAHFAGYFFVLDVQ